MEEELINAEKPEYQVDISDIKQTHNWVKRGIKVSCENAGHPHHSHFLIKSGSL